MHAGRHYSLREVALWTRRETLIFLVIATVPTLLYVLAGWTWLTVPWLPIALVGTAVAFITGFKNNASYSRMWEARQIWGATVNSSRTWGIEVLDYVKAGPAVHARLIHRHLAWLTALRYQLREPRKWENLGQAHNVEYRRHYHVAEQESALTDELAALISAEDLAHVLAKKNRATHLIALQSAELRRLHADGAIDDFRHIEMVKLLAEFYDQQGKSERIKNFPYPRQFATLNLFFVWLFVTLVPFGLLQEFAELGDHFAWLTIPASVIVAWVFHTMDKIGESSENPFEGGPNDVPITALCRTIEIDLRELLGERDVPPALQAVNDILM
ncbi:bestrophin family protein [Nannocystaceae bacterium ST9]